MGQDDMLTTPPEPGAKPQARGGNARATAMLPARRKEIARKAAEARWRRREDEGAADEGLPRATHFGVLKIGDAEIPCAVLENGQRVLTERAFLRALGRDERAKSSKYVRDGGAVGLPPFMTAKALEPFIQSILRAPSVPVKFRPPAGSRSQVQALGYAAELLPEVCRIFVAAGLAGKLTKQQAHIAQKCQVLLDGLANVGIIALVDEATGFQAERDRAALEKILAAYINQELLPWTQRFPSSFYQQMFRLLGWSYNPLEVKRPKLVGKLTDEFVYKQLPPGVREELRKKNPPNANGNRPYRHHQFLTENIGNPHLQNQIVAVTTLMRASRDRKHFYELFRSAFPKPNEQLALTLPDFDMAK